MKTKIKTISPKKFVAMVNDPRYVVSPAKTAGQTGDRFKHELEGVIYCRKRYQDYVKVYSNPQLWGMIAENSDKFRRKVIADELKTRGVLVKGAKL